MLRETVLLSWVTWKEGVTGVESVSRCSEEADRVCSGVGRMLGLVRIVGEWWDWEQGVHVGGRRGTECN